MKYDGILVWEAVCEGGGEAGGQFAGLVIVVMCCDYAGHFVVGRWWQWACFKC